MYILGPRPARGIQVIQTNGTTRSMCYGSTIGGLFPTRAGMDQLGTRFEQSLKGANMKLMLAAVLLEAPICKINANTVLV